MGFFTEVNYKTYIDALKLLYFLPALIEMKKAGFDPAEHPKGDGGRFIEKGGIIYFRKLANALSNGEMFTVKNNELGDVFVLRGNIHIGLIHIILRRFSERALRKKNPETNIENIKKKITSIIYLIMESIRLGEAHKEKNGRYSTERSGIKAIIDRGSAGHFVLTGFDDNQKKEEAEDAIDAVIAEYGYAPEFLDMYAQVGAVIASLGISIPQSGEKASMEKSIRGRQPMQLFIAKTQANKKLVFNAIKQNILRHLDELEEKENAEVKKCFFEMVLAKGGKGYPVGTVRTWKGKKFVKTAPNKWKPKYDGETRGAKMAISALKKKIAACEDAHEMMMIMLSNRERFSDKDGYPLPFVQDLSRFIDEAQENLQAKKQGGYVNKKRAELKEILKDFIGKDITNKKSGIAAYISVNTVNKLGSEKAIEKTKSNGFSIDEHFYAANRIVELFRKADEPAVYQDRNNDPNTVSIKRFNSDLELKNGKRVNAYITVKESIIGRHKIYSIEVMELKKASDDGGLGSAASKTSVTDTLANAPHRNISISQSAEKSSSHDDDIRKAIIDAVAVIKARREDKKQALGAMLNKRFERLKRVGA